MYSKSLFIPVLFLASCNHIKSINENPSHTNTIDTALFYGIWTSNPTGPHADFVISKERFLLVDAENQDQIPYQLDDHQLTLYFPDFTKKGSVLSVNNDSLVIQWQNPDSKEYYLRWCN